MFNSYVSLPEGKSYVYWKSHIFAPSNPSWIPMSVISNHVLKRLKIPWVFPMVSRWPGRLIILIKQVAQAPSGILDSFDAWHRGRGSPFPRGRKTHPPGRFLHRLTMEVRKKTILRGKNLLPSGKDTKNWWGNHHVQCVNPLFLWLLSSSQTLSLPEANLCNGLSHHKDLPLNIRWLVMSLILYMTITSPH